MHRSECGTVQPANDGTGRSHREQKLEPARSVPHPRHHASFSGALATPRGCASWRRSIRRTRPRRSLSAWICRPAHPPSLQRFRSRKHSCWISEISRPPSALCQRPPAGTTLARERAAGSEDAVVPYEVEPQRQEQGREAPQQLERPRRRCASSRPSIGGAGDRASSRRPDAYPNE